MAEKDASLTAAVALSTYTAVAVFPKAELAALHTHPNRYTCARELQRISSLLWRGNWGELLLTQAEVPSQTFHVALDNLYFGHAAALGALPAIDRVLNFLGSAAELALDKVVRFDPAAEAKIFVAILFAQAPDLN